MGRTAKRVAISDNLIIPDLSISAGRAPDKHGTIVSSVQT